MSTIARLQIAALGLERVRLLVTSRQALILSSALVHIHHLSHLRQHEAVRLVTKIAMQLTKEDAETVADLSQRVPLLLRLVANALAAGRIGMLVSDVHGLSHYWLRIGHDLQHRPIQQYSCADWPLVKRTEW